MRPGSTAAANEDPRHAPPALALDAIVDAAGDSEFRIDPYGLRRHASQRAQRLCARAGELRGSPLPALALDIDQPALRNAIVDATARAEPVLVEARLRTGDMRVGDQETWFELRVSLLGA